MRVVKSQRIRLIGHVTRTKSGRIQRISHPNTTRIIKKGPIQRSGKVGFSYSTLKLDLNG